jgi:hypothetical protein
MSYKITHSYNWYDTKDGKYIIKTYHINNVPFTFDEIPKIAQEDPEIIAKAELQFTYTPEYFYKASFYLIDEEAHPLLFELDLENPQDLPEDGYEFIEEDLTS